MIRSNSDGGTFHSINSNRSLSHFRGSCGWMVAVKRCRWETHILLAPW